MKKYSLILLVLFLSTVHFFAQENSDAIEMPDVSTVIKQETNELVEDSLPDFSEIIPDENQVLPSAEVDLPQIESEQVVEDNTNTELEETHYFEGSVGGGYPGIFSGDFSLSRSDKKGLFSFDFSHDSVNGYGKKTSIDGYFDNLTKLSGDGTINFTDKFTMDFDGNYSSSQFGLQGLSPVFYSTALQQGKVSATTNFLCNDYISLFGQLGSNFSSWYASFVPSQKTEDLIPSMNRFGLQPRIGLIANAGNFNCVFDGSYRLETATNNFAVNRGDINYKMNIRVNNFLLNGNIGLVFLKENTLCPFSLGFDFTNLIEVSLSGGLSSAQKDIYQLQQNLLLQNSVVTSEQSDWFISCKLMIPMLEIIENHLDVDFATTAFENGELCLDYSQYNSQTGLFDVVEFEGTRLNTDYSMIMYLDNSQISASWKAYWLDIPTGVSPHTMKLLYSYISEKNVWSLTLGASMNIGGDRTILGDIIPDTSFTFSYRPGKMFTLTLQLSDMIKLFSGTERTLYGNYIQKSGYASLYVSFYL